MFTPARTPISLIDTALSPPALIASPQRAEACGDTVFDTKVNTIIYDRKQCSPECMKASALA